MREVIGHYYDVEPEMDMYSFSELFIVTLGYLNNTYIKEEGKIITELPADYFTYFDKSLNSDFIMENGKNIVINKYSKLFDINEYYDNKYAFKFELDDCISIILNKYLVDGIADLKYNFRNSCWYIKMPIEHTKKVLDKYDSTTKENMFQFVFSTFTRGDMDTLINSKCNDCVGKSMVKTYLS